MSKRHSFPNNQAPKKYERVPYGHGVHAGTANILLRRRFVADSAFLLFQFTRINPFPAHIALLDGRWYQSRYLRATALVPPVTYASGQFDKQYADKRGNRALNATIYLLAVRLIGSGAGKITNHFIHGYFHRKVAEGKTKKHAIKCVQRRLVNIIWWIRLPITPPAMPPLLPLTAISTIGTLTVLTVLVLLFQFCRWYLNRQQAFVPSIKTSKAFVIKAKTRGCRLIATTPKG